MTAAPRKRAAAKAAPTTKGNHVSDNTKPQEQAPASTEPGCQHPLCTLEHPHAGPAVLAPPAPAGLQLEQLEHCPTPGLCFPYGLPVDASHAACVHGETHAAE